MFSYVYLFYLVIAAAEQFKSKEFPSLRCLLEENNQPCEANEDHFIQKNITLFSPQLIQDYSVLDYLLIKSIENQDFKDLEEKSLQDVPAGIILSIPVCHLSDLKGRVLASLIFQWKNHEVIFKHVVKAFLNSKYVDTFSNMLQSFDFADANLRWIAEVASANNTEAARDLLTRIPLLFYSPPESVILNSKPDRFFFLSLLDNSKDQNSMSLNKPVLRFWAYTMINNKFPESLRNWNNFYIERWGFFLTGATTDELKQLMVENIDNLQELFRLKFSSIQVRSLFDKFFLKKALNENQFRSLSQAVTQLLPIHISSFPIDVGELFTNFIPFNNAYSSSRQILEMISANEFQNQTSDLKYSVSNFISALPLINFQKFLNRSMNMSDFLTIQSTQLTKSKMYYLSVKHNIFNFKSEDIFRCLEYIKVLPAKDIIFNNSASHVLFHILSNIDATNVPQAFAIFNKLWPVLSSASVFQRILSNSQPNVLLNYIPSRHLWDNNEKLLQIITIDDHKKLPPVLVSSISKKLKDISSSFIYYNTNRSSAFLLTSVTCDDVVLFDPYHFIMFLSDYNNYMKLSGKMISKNIQQCCINKLLEVLQLKYLLVPNPPYKSKLSLLNEAEIDAIGGYILSGLPVTSIGNSRHTRSIIKTIGKLTVGELLSAVPLIHLQKLASLLAQTISPSEKISFSLFDFGNLTLFLEPKYIEQMNKEYFRLFLEGNYIDQRVCANQSVRSAWYKLIKTVFGEPDDWTYQTLVTLGDFLIVVPTTDLMKIKDKQWIYATDSLITKYYDTELDGYLKFYEVCTAYLNNEEKLLYIDDLKKLIAILVRAAQLQINTIVPAETLIQRNREAKTEIVFNFVDSNKEIKFSFSPTKVVIEKELTHDNLTLSVPNYSDKSEIYDSSVVETTTTVNSDISEESNSTRINSLNDKYNETYQITSGVESSTEDSITTVNLFIHPSLNNYNSSKNDTITNFLQTNGHDEYKYNSSSTSMINIISESSTEKAKFNFFKFLSILGNKLNNDDQSKKNDSVSTNGNFVSDFDLSTTDTSVSDSMDILDSEPVTNKLSLVGNFTTLPPESIEYTNGEKTQEFISFQNEFSSQENISTKVEFNTQKYTSTGSESNIQMHASTENILNSDKQNSAGSEFSTQKYTSTGNQLNSKKQNEPSIENEFSSNEGTYAVNEFIAKKQTSTDSVFNTNMHPYTENTLHSEKQNSVGSETNTQKHISIGSEFYTKEYPSTENQLNSQTHTSTESQLNSQTHTSTESQLNSQTHTSTENPLNAQKHTSTESVFTTQKHISTGSGFYTKFTSIETEFNSLKNHLIITDLPRGKKYAEKYASETDSNSLDTTNSINSPFEFVMDEADALSTYTEGPEILYEDNNNPDIIETKPFLGQTVRDFKKDNIDPHIENLINDKSNSSHTTFLLGHINSSHLNSVLGYNIIDRNNVNDDYVMRKAEINQNLKMKMNKNFKLEKVVTKRAANEKWSCEALKMVGKATELILNESVISSLDDEDLINCIDLFAEMNLSKSTQAIIWKRIKPDNFITAGKLVAACDISDVQSRNFSFNNRLSLENFYSLGKYNTDPNVRKHIVDDIWRTMKKPYPVELVASLGSLICDLPDVNSEIIEPSVLYKTSVVLGRALPCNFTCLSRLAGIATHEDSFNDPLTWNFGDVHDLGIIVSGLNINGWKTMILRNNDALAGLSEAAFECLPYKYKKMMKKIPIDILPQAISNRFMEYDTHNKLRNFDFYTPSSYPKSISFAILIAPQKIIIMFCLLILLHYLL